MKILISSLPRNPWWGHGTPIYENNPAMREGVVPNQTLVEIEMELMNHLFSLLPVETVLVDFPHILDKHNFDLRKHDFVFVRDLFTSNRNGRIVISKFREKARQLEADIMEVYLNGLGYKTLRIDETSDMYAEGGEFYYCKNENILFSGLSRNNIAGSEKVSDLLDANELILIKTNAFHLDTIFTPVFNMKNELVALILCMDLIEKESKVSIVEFCKKRSIELIDVPPEDAIGTDIHLGEFAVNCLPIPGYLIGPARFRSDSVDPLLKSLGVMHISLPMTQFRLSGGAVHCLTNEL